MVKSISMARSLPSRVTRGAMARARRMALGGGDHVLGAVVDHFHGLAGFPREQRGVSGDHRRIFFLAAEAAAGFGLHDADAILAAGRRGGTSALCT